ncbi:MAG: N-(5'-phosphoribosyl)anthranilate isomerase, partial [Paracoccaceae bacterium]
MANVRVKICGLRTLEDVATVAAVGAAYAGFVFFAKSPRHLTVDQARPLALSAPEGLCKVALTVDADDATLDAIVGGLPLDMLQLHG